MSDTNGCEATGDRTYWDRVQMALADRDCLCDDGRSELCFRCLCLRALKTERARAETAEGELETARAARCHSCTVVPGVSESPECAEVPTMCSRHAHGLMAALREAESAAATAQRERR